MPEPRKPDKEHRDRLIEEAAWWNHCGYSQKEVAEIMGLNPRMVRTLLEEARASRLIETQFDIEKVKPQRIEELRNMRAVSGALNDHLAGISELQSGAKVFQHLSVFATGCSGTSHEAFEKNLAYLARPAGERLRDWLAECTLIGVAWGQTLASAFEAMAEHTNNAPDFRKRGVRVIPLLGETLALRKLGHSASQLAAKLQAALASDKEPALSLAGVAAVIPRDFQERGEIATIRRFLSASPAYERIFVKDSISEPLVKRLDAIITSVSLTGAPNTMAEQDLLEIGGVGTAYRNLVVGDIGGVLLKKRDLKNRQHADFEKICELLTGVTFEHYRTLAERTAEGGSTRNDTPGVIVIATGADKASVVLRAIELHLVNRLICDTDLLEKLAELCKRPPWRNS